jgi:hypothetical protein
MGWLARLSEGNCWYNGLLQGSTSLLVRTGSGVAWAVLLNPGLVGTSLSSELDQTIWQAVREVNGWPSHDLFSQY